MPEMMRRENPDAAQDERLVVAILERNLGPIFQALGARIRDLEEDLSETKDLLFKFAQGLIGAADGHRRSVLSDELSSKYGSEMEPFEGFYKDTQGKGFSESLLEELMGDGAPDEAGRDDWIKNKLNEAKGKYGKYVGVSVEAPAPEEVAEESAEAPEEQAIEESEGEELAEPEMGDPVSAMMSKVLKSGGERRSLSKSK